MKITSVLPFYSGDAERAAAMLDWTADLSGQRDRTIILAHEDGVPFHEVERAASRAFKTVEHLSVKACAQGWPISANCYFACIAPEMRSRGPWLLLEHDVTFTDKLALEMIEQDYATCGKANFGAIIPMFFNKNGVWTEAGKMLAGVAVYHPNLWDNSPLLRSLMATQQTYAAWAKKTKTPPIPKAFDCYLAPEIMTSVFDSRLFQHMGRSRNFRRENGQIVCDYESGARWDPVIGRNVVLVHGCKDGSLINLLRAEMRIAEKKGEPGPAAKIVQIARPDAPQFASQGVQWSDEKKPEPKQAAAPAPVRRDAPPAPPERPGLAPVPNQEAVSTLADYRLEIQHWPECAEKLYGLNEQRGRFRITCQCGAKSPKLPQGYDWEGAWRASAGTPVATVQVHGDAKNVTIEKEETRPAETSVAGVDPAWDKLERDAGIESKPAVPVEVGETLTERHLSSTYAVFRTFEDGEIVTMFKWEHDALLARIVELEGLLAGKKKVDVPWPEPGTTEDKQRIAALRHRKDIIKRFPELKELTPDQLRVRIRQIKKKAREDLAKTVGKELTKRASWLLTEEARARKMELYALGKGKRGAFINLRRVAESLGVSGSVDLDKDQMIVAILEKEFENPYLEEKVEKKVA